MDNRNNNKDITTENSSINKKDRKAQKKGVIAIFAILAAAIVILPLLNMIDFDSLIPKESEDEHNTQEVTTSTLGDHHFTEPDYDEDIMQDPEYLKLDRSLHYTYMNETFGVMTEAEALEHGAVCAMFRKYFDYAMQGDSDGYNSLFTSDYIKKNGKVNIAPQKIYDIKVECLSSMFLEDGDANGEYVGYYLYQFDVAYSIFDNNGTLRKDFLGDEGQQPLVFQVIEGNGEVKISSIGVYVYGEPQQIEQPVFENGILLIVLAVICALLILAEVFTKKGVALALMIASAVGIVIAAFNVSAVIVVGATLVLGVILVTLRLILIGKRKKATPAPESEIISR